LALRLFLGGAPSASIQPPLLGADERCVDGALVEQDFVSAGCSMRRAMHVAVLRANGGEGLAGPSGPGCLARDLVGFAISPAPVLMPHKYCTGCVGVPQEKQRRTLIARGVSPLGSAAYSNDKLRAIGHTGKPLRQSRYNYIRKNYLVNRRRNQSPYVGKFLGIPAVSVADARSPAGRAFQRSNPEDRVQVILNECFGLFNRQRSAHFDCVWKGVPSGADLAYLHPGRRHAVQLELLTIVRNISTPRILAIPRALRTRLGYSQGSWFQHSPKSHLSPDWSCSV